MALAWSTESSRPLGNTHSPLGASLHYPGLLLSVELDPKPAEYIGDEVIQERE
jgi:hypothetical protein